MEMQLLPLFGELPTYRNDSVLQKKKKNWCNLVSRRYVIGDHKSWGAFANSRPAVSITW